MEPSGRPLPDEYGDFHAAYISVVPEGDIRERLEASLGDLREFYGGIAEAAGNHAYEIGKWTVREVVGHIADSERVFAYRALRFGRGDETALPGFDQEIFVPNSNAATRPWASILADLFAVREATLHLFRSFTPRDWLRRGEASGISMTVRAAAWVIVGHELHHRRILRERYGL